MDEDKILTRFTGIPFDKNPYTVQEARVVLRSLMRELRLVLAQSRGLPVADEPSTKPLTGPWDVIRFDFAAQDIFTRHPHLTVALNPDEVSIQITVSNSAKSVYWQPLRTATEEDLENVLGEVARRAAPLRREVRNRLAEPRIVFDIMQRHFLSRMGPEVLDARLRFDVDTLIEAGDSSVKKVPGWLPAACAILRNSSRANMQIQLRAAFPYAEGSVCTSSDFVRAAADSAAALSPFLTFVTRSA